jgi:hypothetical protein
MKSPGGTPDAADDEPLVRSSTGWWALCLVAFALFVSTTAWFFFGSAFGAVTDSDSAVSALLAEEILRTGQPVPQTWYFVNAEIWTFGPQYLALPFVAALGLTPLALKLGNLLALCTMLWFIALPVQRITRSWPFAGIVATGMLACYSALQAQMIYAQPAYGWFCAQFALLIFLSLRIQDESQALLIPPRRPHWTLIAYVLVVLNLVVESPLRAMAYWIVPFFAICVAAPVSRRRANGLMLATGATLVLGVAIRYALAAHLLIIRSLAATFLGPPSTWAIHATNVLQGLPVMTGDDATWPSLATFVGFGSVARISFLAAAAAAVAIAVPLGRRVANPECRFVARLAAALLAIVVATLIVGQLAVNFSAIRYLLPPAILCLVAFMSLLWCAWGVRSKRLMAVATIFVLIFCGGAVPFVAKWSARATTPGCDAPAFSCRLQAVLSQNGLRKGYATYWNANVTTLASNGRLAVCGLRLKPQVQPHRWLVSKTCFDPPEDPRYFIALTRPEIQQSGRQKLIADVGVPDQVVDEGTFEIWIYQSAKANTAWLGR